LESWIKEAGTSLPLKLLDGSRKPARPAEMFSKLESVFYTWLGDIFPKRFSFKTTADSGIKLDFRTGIHGKHKARANNGSGDTALKGVPQQSPWWGTKPLPVAQTI